MMNHNIAALRSEYRTLKLMLDGLVEIVSRRNACNLETMSRMANDARAAARRMASEIERLVFESRPAPVKSKPTFGEKVCGFLSRMANALIGKPSAIAA